MHVIINKILTDPVALFAICLFAGGEDILYYENFDLENVVTLVNVEHLKELLNQTGYDKRKSEFLIDGFENGFSIGYEGNMKIKRTSPNLKLRVGNEVELWNKIMKKVKEGRYAGPFSEPSFEYFIQSPIGLVPKDNGMKTHLIFHLSYPRTGDSVNSETPREYCTVNYCEFDQAIKHCIEEGKRCHISCSDFSAAFRNLGIKKAHWPLLIMKARNPLDRGKGWVYFIDKCLPFGASISCAHFQSFSDTVAHIVEYFTKKKVTNYLDDFLFAPLLRLLCNRQVQTFLRICQYIRFPVNMDKTFSGSTQFIFLGLLIDTIRQIVCVPVEKIQKAVALINETLSQSKITLLRLQKLCGFLNFLCRAIVPGRAFTRCLYVHTASKGSKLKPHHHIKITGEMKADMRMWLSFLERPEACSRPFLDYSGVDAIELDLYSDASRNFDLGFGGICGINWVFGKWDQFTKNVEPSIEYLELFAVMTVVLLLIKRFRNKRVTLFCDNMSVVHMINGMSSSCRNCMVMIRKITLEGLLQNVRIFAKHVRTNQNGPSDALSRLQFQRFKRITLAAGKVMAETSECIPEDIWPIEKIWLKN